MTKPVKRTHDMDLLSQRAEVFRSKLIEDFHLLATINEKGKVEIPKYYTRDISDQKKLKQLMTSNPHGLVRFQVYTNKDITAQLGIDRRQNRLKNKMSRTPPLDMWAHWVVESAWFQNSILTLILINCVVLGIQAEYNDKDDPSLRTLKKVLDIFDYCTLYIFVIEILLKWLDGFFAFWKSGWNVFDFIVTFFSFVPEIMNFSMGSSATGTTADLRVIAENLRVFRVLRSLKMVTRFRQVRLIALAVGKAFQSMLFITMLFFTFMYIFAIAGVMFFGGHSSATKQLKYKDSFSSITDALITLIQLFTLDHWLAIYKDVIKLASPWFSGIYMITWIIMGSFIFRNIFVGIMVNNFQSIRNELFREVRELRAREKRENEMAEFAEELTKQEGMVSTGPIHDSADDLLTELHVPDLKISTADQQKASEHSTKLHGVESIYRTPQELKEAMSEHMVKETRSSTEWQNMVEKNLVNLAKEEANFCWPRDSLFHYFLMMEALQENLKERQELVNLALDCLLNMQDS